MTDKVAINNQFYTDMPMSNNSSSSTCKLVSSPWDDLDIVSYLKDLEFVGDGLFTSIVCLVGMIGNLSAILVFNRPELRSTFHANLSVLAAFDFAYTLVRSIDSLLKWIDYYQDTSHLMPCEGSYPNILWITLYPYVVWPLSNIFMTASMYMTVAISIDRYIVVCHPFYACKRELPLVHHPLWPLKCPVDSHRVLKYFTSVLLFSALFCLPTFFEFKIGICPSGYTSIMWTSLRQHYIYGLVYMTALDVFVRYLVPVSILIYTNLR